MIFCLILLCAAQAQTLNHYYAPELQSNPGTIIVHPGGLTVLEFWDIIEDAYIGDEDVLSIQGRDVTNTLYLGTSLTTARTDMTVLVGGQQHLFKVEVKSPSTGPKLYVIEKERPAPQVALSSPSISASKDELNLEIVSANRTGTESSIFFRFTNQSAATVALDSSRLRAIQQGKTLTTRIQKTPAKQIVNPEETHTGYILLSGVSQGELNLEWTITTLGSGQEMIFDEVLNLP